MRSWRLSNCSTSTTRWCRASYSPTSRHLAASHCGLQTTTSKDSSPGLSGGPTNICAMNENDSASAGSVAGSGSRCRCFSSARTGAMMQQTRTRLPRSACFGLSQITWRTSVAHHPAQDNGGSVPACRHRHYSHRDRPRPALTAQTTHAASTHPPAPAATGTRQRCRHVPTDRLPGGRLTRCHNRFCRSAPGGIGHKAAVAAPGVVLTPASALAVRLSQAASFSPFSALAWCQLPWPDATSSGQCIPGYRGRTSERRHRRRRHRPPSARRTSECHTANTTPPQSARPGAQSHAIDQP